MFFEGSTIANFEKLKSWQELKSLVAFNLEKLSLKIQTLKVYLLISSDNNIKRLVHKKKKKQYKLCLSTFLSLFMHIWHIQQKNHSKNNILSVFVLLNLFSIWGIYNTNFQTCFKLSYKTLLTFVWCIISFLQQKK